MGILDTFLESDKSWNEVQEASALSYQPPVDSGESGYDSIISEASELYGVDPDLIRSVIKAESNFRPDAVSGAGAEGLMQLMPGTSQEMGIKDIANPHENIMGGTKYLARQLKTSGGDIPLALAAYNAGPGNVKKYGGIPPFAETQGYISKVTKHYEGYKKSLGKEGRLESDPFDTFLDSDKPWDDVRKEESTFFERIGKAWETGEAQSQIGSLRYRQLIGDDTDELKASIEQIKATMPKRSDVKRSLPERAVAAAAEMLPIQIEGLKKGTERGLKLGMGAGAIAAVAGQAGPQAALPEEIITVPAAFAGMYGVGMVSGAIENIGQIEAGLAYDELLDIKDSEGRGINPTIAKGAAAGVGVVNGLIEMAQIRLLLKTIPGGEKLLTGIIRNATKKIVTSKTLKNLALKYAGKYGMFIGAETAQEIAQESTNIIVGEVAKSLTNKLDKTNIPASTKEEIVHRLVETATQSALAFSVMGAPGTVVSGGVEATRRVPKIPDVEPSAPITEPSAPSTDEIRTKYDAGEFTSEDLEAIKEIWSDDAELSSAIGEILKPKEPTGAIYKAQKKRQEKLSKEFAQYEKDLIRAKQEMADQDRLDEIKLSSEQRQKLIEDEFKGEIEAQKQDEKVEAEISRLKARKAERAKETEERRRGVKPEKVEDIQPEVPVGQRKEEDRRKEDRKGPERRKAERRDVATRKLIDKLSPEEKEFAIPELRRMLKTQKKAALRQEKIADSDPLTGLKNRRGLRKETAKREKEGKETVHTFIDLIGFKGLNDYISHEAGDATLKFIAKAMKSVGLENSTRWGGDELMFQAESLETGDTDAQKLHDYFEKNPLRLKGKEGKEYDLTVMFRHGTAKSVEEADEIAEAAKETEPPEWKRGKAHPGLKEVKAVEAKKPPDTGESLAKEFGLRYMGEADGLEYYSMKHPEGETTIATKGVDRAQLLKKIEQTKKTFGEIEPAKPTPSKAIHDYSSTQVNLPEESAKSIKELGLKIPDKELYTEPDDDSYGREEAPHITVRYGLETSSPEDVAPAFEDIGPIKVKFGKVSIFESDDYDVVKVDVESPDLIEANKKVGETVKLPGETFKDYKPHATIAYVKKGEGKKYVGDKSLEGQEVIIDSIFLSAKDGKMHEIKLEVAPEKPATEKPIPEPAKPEEVEGAKAPEVVEGEKVVGKIVPKKKPPSPEKLKEDIDLIFLDLEEGEVYTPSAIKEGISPIADLDTVWDMWKEGQSSEMIEAATSTYESAKKIIKRKFLLKEQKPTPAPEKTEVALEGVGVEKAYRPGSLEDAIKIRKEHGSLDTYDLQSKKEWLGDKKPPDDGKLTIYRATPTGKTIEPGDYVTNDIEYAKQHIESNLGGKGKIARIEATLDDIYPADSPKEFWYAPKSIEPLYSTAKEAAPRSRADKVFETVLPYLQGMTNFPTVRVVQSIDQLPKQLRAKVTAFSKQKDKQVEGFYDKEGDQVFLIADNLSEGRIEAVLRHEAEGHRGIRLLLGSDLDGFLDGVAKAKKDDLLTHDPGLDFKDQAAVRVAADEWIARKIEAGNLSKSFWDDLVRIFRKWLRKIVPNLSLTDSEIRSVLVDTVKNVREGRIDRIRTPEGRLIFSSIADQWYSQMTRFMSDKLPGKSPPAQFKQTINAWAKKGLIKQEELDWSGLNEWLDEQEGKVTKQQVLDFLAENNIRIEEVFKDTEGEPILRYLVLSKSGGSYFVESRSEAESEYNKGSQIQMEDPDSGETLAYTNEYYSFNEAYESAIEMAVDYGSVGETKFSQWVLPGGEAYKELLLTLPIKPKVSFNEWVKTESKGSYPTNTLFSDLPSHMQAILKRRFKKYEMPETYTSAHGERWDETNILAWIRFDERTGPNGEKILHIAEIQSDWHQEGRKEGYKGEFSKEQEDALDKARSQLAKNLKGEDYLGFDNLVYALAAIRQHADFATRWEMSPSTVKLGEEYGSLAREKERFKRSVPDAPFKKTWPLLTIKRMVRYAAENGFDAISWDVGEVQADRYDLSKQIDRVEYGSNELFAFKDGEKVISEMVTEDKLADYIGKEAASKLLKKPEETIYADTVSGKKPLYEAKILEGLDLKVGGEGMKSFYNRLLPNVVNKFFNKKAWGNAKVETAELFTRDPEEVLDMADAFVAESIKADPESYAKVHFLPITPEMKEKVLGEGMPLFSIRQELTEKQRIFLERHYPEKLEGFEKEFKRKSGGTISKESLDGSKAFAKMGEIPSSPEGFNMPYEGKGGQVFDLLQFKIQDRLNSLRKVQKTIEKQEATEIPDDTNAYQTEELYHGKVARRVGEFDTDHLDPLMDSIHESGFDLEDVEEFLYARHAPEANKRLQDINPEREDNKALSGMSNEEAETIMARYADNKAMLDIVARIDVITKKTRQVLVDEGLATPGEVAAWENTYKYYVPLKREGKAVGMPKKGKGMDIGGAESKRRLVGSAERKAANILTNIIAQHESSIIRAEKAKVGRAMLKLAEAHPNKELWEVDAPELKPFLKQRKSEEIDEITGLPATLSEVVYGKDILYKFNDNVLVVKVAGKEHTITFNDQNVHAQRMARSLKNLGADNSNAVINTLAAVNRLLAIVNTSANPEFIISNFARDIQTAGYNINDTEAKNLKVKIFKDVFKALQGIRRGIREDYSSEWAKNFKDFAKAGAQTGWTDHYKNIEAREKSLKKKLDLLKDGKWSSAQRAARGLFEFVSNENTAVENAIRLSTYTHLKRIGLSDAKAASAAKNLTVNFNRRGDMGQALNALYLFFNANVQGSARLIYAAARSPRVRRMMYGTVAFAVMLDILNRAIGGDDDDGEKKYDKIPSWVKEHNLVLMRPNGDYFKLPLPWGYNTLHVLGQSIGEAIDPNKDEFSAMAAAGRLGSAIVGSFNPLGSESTILQLAAPTIADPFVQWAENQNFAGIPIKPEQLPFDVPKPEYQMYWQNSRRPSRWITKKFNDLTGGDEVKPGLVNVSPEVIDLFVDTFAGGAGRFIDNTIKLPGTLTKKDIDVRRIPFIRKVYGESPDYYLRTKFYDNLGEIKYAEKSKKHYSDDKDKLVDVKKRYAWELRFVNRVKSDKARIRNLRKKRRMFENQKELSKRDKEKKVEEIEKRVTEIMTKFNRTYKDEKDQKKIISQPYRKPVAVTKEPLTLRQAMKLQ